MNPQRNTRVLGYYYYNYIIIVMVVSPRNECHTVISLGCFRLHNYVHIQLISEASTGLL